MESLLMLREEKEVMAPIVVWIYRRASTEIRKRIYIELSEIV